MIHELKQEVIHKVNQFIEIYENTFSTTIPPIEIVYGLTGSSYAGLAYTHSNKIKLHEEFLLKYRDEYITDTVGHEVAHILTAHRFGHDVKIHGKEWKFIMAMLGLKPTRTHNYVSENNKKRHNKYIFNCSKCNAELIVSQTIYNKMAKGKRYHSKCCNASIINNNEKLGQVSYIEAIKQITGK